LNGGTPTDQELEEMIMQAQKLNMKILLKPHVDPRDGFWRAWIGTYFDEADWDAWFESYGAYMTHYAKLAQKWNVDVFSCGVEMITASRNEQQFRKVVDLIRSFYKGKVTYSANWGNKYQSPVPPHHHDIVRADPLGVLDTITWIDALDVIGVDAYYFLTTVVDPTMDQVLEGWSKIVPRLANISSFWGKNIIFTEIGYRSIEGSAVHPAWWNITAPVNLTQQALCYEAVFETFQTESWWEGIYWWIWSTDPSYGGPQNTDFTPQNKPLTEKVLAKYYGQLNANRDETELVISPDDA